MLYQAQHGPLYYRLAAPVYSWSGGSSNLQASIAVLRALNLLFVAGALALALASIGKLLPPSDARIVGLLISVQPLFLQNSVRVANDPLALLLATFVVALALHPRVQRSLLLSMVLGLAAGAAAIVKAFGMALVPFLGVSYFVSVVTGGLTWRRALLCGGLSVASASLLIVPTILGNFELYGSLTPMQEGLANKEAGRGVSALFEAVLAINWPRRLGSSWLHGSTWVGGWSFISTGSTGSTLRLLVSLIVIAMLGGWCWRWASPRARFTAAFSVPGTALRLTGLIAFVTAALCYHMVQSQTAWGVVTTNSWYAAFAFPWALALAYVGAPQWPGRGVGIALAGWLAALYLGAEVNGAFFRMMPFYSDATGLTAFERMASLRPELLGFPTLCIASAATIGLLGVVAWSTTASLLVRAGANDSG